MVLQENPSSFSFSPLKPAFFHLTPFAFFSSSLNSFLLFFPHGRPSPADAQHRQVAASPATSTPATNPGPTAFFPTYSTTRGPKTPLPSAGSRGAMAPRRARARRTAAPAPSWPKFQGRGAPIPLPESIPGPRDRRTQSPAATPAAAPAHGGALVFRPPATMNRSARVFYTIHDP